MKILHVITTLDIGGAERLIVDLLPLLQQGNNQVDLLLFNGIDTPFKEELVRKGIHIHQLSCWKGIKHHFEVYNPANILRLKKYIEDYDIIHTHNTACQFYVALAAKSCKRPVLVTTEHSTYNHRRSWKWFKHIDEWMYSKYAAIICISNQASVNLIDYIGCPNKIHTVFNGVDVTDELVNGYYTTPEITAESTLSVTYETNVTGISSTTINNDVKVIGYNGEIIISQIEEPSDVQIYTVDGKIIDSRSSAFGSVTIQVPEEQLYLVKVGSRTYKVAL